MNLRVSGTYEDFHNYISVTINGPDEPYDSGIKFSYMDATGF